MALEQTSASSGNGGGGTPSSAVVLLLVVAWLWVGVPLAWGVVNTAMSAAPLFESSPAPTQATTVAEPVPPGGH